jgi:FKBP-type peptidyl-prolyl cis-trans isomerase 2
VKAASTAAFLLLACLSLGAQSASPASVVADGTVVSMNYVGMLRDGTVFASTGGEPEDFVIGAGRMLPALENGIRGLAPGDSKIVLISAAELGPGSPLAGKDIVVQVDIVAVRAATAEEMAAPAP